MRRYFPALVLFGLTALSGCGQEKSTNPNELKPLTAADHAEINAKDAEIATEEDGMRSEDPKAKGKAKR